MLQKTCGEPCLHQEANIFDDVLRMPVFQYTADPFSPPSPSLSLQILCLLIYQYINIHTHIKKINQPFGREATRLRGTPSTLCPGSSVRRGAYCSLDFSYFRSLHPGFFVSLYCCKFNAELGMLGGQRPRGPWPGSPAIDEPSNPINQVMPIITPVMLRLTGECY